MRPPHCRATHSTINMHSEYGKLLCISLRADIIGANGDLQLLEFTYCIVRDCSFRTAASALGRPVNTCCRDLVIFHVLHSYHDSHSLTVLNQRRPSISHHRLVHDRYLEGISKKNRKWISTPIQTRGQSQTGANRM
jgi:hypothetical protein